MPSINRADEKIHNVSKKSLSLKTCFCGLESGLLELLLLGLLGLTLSATWSELISSVVMQLTRGWNSSLSLAISPALLPLHLFGLPRTVSASGE